MYEAEDEEDGDIPYEITRLLEQESAYCFSEKEMFHSQFLKATIALENNNKDSWNKNEIMEHCEKHERNGDSLKNKN
ncbi:hypothetical protein MTR_6g025105 [Medicago truncatula]|uniref:Uncharacterized protein n=1 Tax=Medicago truncatula TaxID=3880 RepID=A0A072U8T0_MEDTR|nr:hypothetical protein MTR_6g025105 [Medicago truncatula]